jgi:hypothetical protein
MSDENPDGSSAPHDLTSDRVGFRRFVAFLLVSTPAFCLFAYNSGYGYDAIEHLTLGRALAEGLPFYTYFPSKGPGVYVFVALLESAGFQLGHVSLAAIIALIYAAIVGATGAVVRSRYGWAAAMQASVLLAVSTAAMELNFLETEGFVFLGGLGAMWLVLDGIDSVAWSPTRLLAAGLLVGTAAHFKSVALFYGLALALFLIATGIRGQLSVLDLSRNVRPFVLGTLVAFAAPALYFAVTGRFSAWWRWSVSFPLLDYPSSGYYLGKFATKLLGFHALFTASVLASVTSSRLRRVVYADSGAVLSLSMGLCSGLALVKSQASHFYFPAAAFLAIFTALVARHAIGSMHPTRVPRRIVTGLIVLSCLLAPALWYRSDAVPASRPIQGLHFPGREPRGVRSSSRAGGTSPPGAERRYGTVLDFAPVSAAGHLGERSHPGVVSAPRT